MADLQEVYKTHPKSYPSYFHTYPRNGKTTVVFMLIYHDMSDLPSRDFDKLIRHMLMTIFIKVT